MAQYRLEKIASLARQMAFTPIAMRDRQLAAAEELAITIDPAKAYPPDYIVFTLTGYDPKLRETDMFTGLALQHDLGLLVEQVSETLKQKTSDRAEPVLSIDDLTEKFNVTSKTIQRWRKKGLCSRRFIFPDGKLRVGFRLNVVEKFLMTHRAAVERGANFSQVDDAERGQILIRARELAVNCKCCMNEISRRLARKFNRSPLTIQATIRKHDEENPTRAIFPMALSPLDDIQQARVIRILRKGGTLAMAARRVKRSRSAIYRVVLDARLSRLMDRKMKFFDDPLYHQEEAESLLNDMARDQGIMAQGTTEQRRVPDGLPSYLRDLYRIPLLTPNRERALFLKLNFHKYQFINARKKIDPAKLRVRDLNQLDLLLKKVIETKNQIVRANLRLVVSVARKHLRNGINLMELVSEGNVTLMRTVDSFNVQMGNKFSTYATLALMKGFVRTVPQLLADKSRARTVETINDMPDRQLSSVDRVADREQVQKLLARLNHAERRVIGARFGIDSVHASDRSSLASELGVSHSRLKQIERTALDKLRTVAEKSN